MLFIIVASVFGLLFGSFLNVVIYRLPQMASSGIAPRGKSWMFLSLPLSFCPKCKTPIAPTHNIPVVSYLLLRGRAKCCGEPISACYPMIELSGAVIAGAAAWRFGTGLDFVFAVIFLSMLLVASVIDMRRYYLLDILTLPLLWFGLLINIDSRFALLHDAVIGAAAGYLVLRMLAGGAEMVMQRPTMGGGDFKLMAALGAWLGWQMLPLALFGACILGLAYAFVFSLWKHARRKKRNLHRPTLTERFCFGPSLSLAGAIMLFWGNEITLAYWQFIGRG